MGTVSTPFATPTTLTYDAQYKEIYVAFEAGVAVQIISGTTSVGSLFKPNGICSISGGGLYGIVYDPTNSLLYATCGEGGVVVVIQPNNSTSASVVGVINFGNYVGLGDITYDIADNLLYTVAPSTSSYPMQVIAIDPTTDTVAHVIKASSSWAACQGGQTYLGTQCEIAYDPASNTVVVGDSSQGEIACVNTASFTITDCIPYTSGGSESGSVGGFAYDSSNQLLYVANYYTNMVSAISGTTIVANYLLPAQPYMLAYDSQNGQIYATTGTGYVYLVANFTTTSSAWNETASYPSGLEKSSCAVNSNYVYCVGGVTLENSTTFVITNAVYYAELSFSGGIIGNWIQTTNYPTTIWNEQCVTYNGYIYCTGGATNNNYGDDGYSLTQDVYYAQLSSSGGIVGNWTLSSLYPIPIYLQSCTTYQGYLYCVGGITFPYSELTNAVYYTQLSQAGVGQWQEATSYPSLRGYVNLEPPTCVTSSTPYIYCIGDDTNSTYYAQLSESGGIFGNWTQTTSYPFSAWLPNQECVSENMSIFCVGGFDGNTQYLTNAVFDSQFSSAGGIQDWNSGSNYPIYVVGHSCFSSSGYLYCVGGQYSSGRTSDSVYYAPVSSIFQYSSTISTRATSSSHTNYADVLFTTILTLIPFIAVWQRKRLALQVKE